MFPTRLPTSQLPLKLENVPHSLGDDPLAFAMRSDGKTEQLSRRSEPGVVPLCSLLPLFPSSLTSPLDT